MHLELVTVSATAAATTGTAATALAGDSLVIKNANRSRKVHIIAAWQTNQSAGFSQLTFPSAHDTTRGFRCGIPIATMCSTLPFGVQMEVQPQETLAPTIGATAVAGDVENMSMLIRYEDLPGIDARLMKADAVESRIEQLTTIENSLTSTAGPSYGTPELVTADSDLLKANRDYALLGFCSRTNVHAIYMLAPDFGNVRVGCPGMLRPEITSQWFLLQSRLHNEPLVPVINSGNKNSTFIGVVTDENAGTFVVTAFLALLK